MTLAEFFATAAGARVIRLRRGDSLLDLLHFFHSQQVHDLVGITPAPKQISHHAHRPVDMVEEQLVASAQVVQPWLTVRRMNKAVARTLAITGEQHLAIAAVLGQRIEFVLAEFALPVGGNQLYHL